VTGADGVWPEDDTGRLVRPYTVTGGRTQPTRELDLMTLVIDTGRVRPARLDVEHSLVLGYCMAPTSVAEVAARTRLPAIVAKILVADLIDCGALDTRAPWHIDDPLDTSVLEAVLDGLRRRL